MLMTACGFLARDLHAISLCGGALSFVKSSVFAKALSETPFKQDYWAKHWRRNLDDFYDKQGFLVSPLSAKKSSLFALRQSPLIFYGMKNRALLEKKPSVAIVGSRKASEAAIKYTKKLAAYCASLNINVVSGGAQGIDAAAHEGALAALGSTSIISGTVCSLAKTPLASLIKDEENALLLHPFGPFMPQSASFFVLRNQFVVALAAVLIVVEGRENSGTLHSARFAREQKVPVFAVPGALHEPGSFAPNWLIAKGHAKALVDFEQITSELKLERASPAKIKEKLRETQEIKVEIAPNEPLLRLIFENAKSLTIDEMMALSGKSFAELQSELFNYELEGRIMKRGAQFVLREN